jgi:hypothetical protein
VEGKLLRYRLFLWPIAYVAVILIAITALEWIAHFTLILKGYDPRSGQPLAQIEEPANDIVEPPTPQNTGHQRTVSLKEIDDSGRRVGAGEKVYGPAADYKVWMFGNHPLLALELPAHQTVPGYLGKMLDTRDTAWNVEVSNYAGNGYKARNLLLRLLRLLETDRPDVVVFFLGSLDFEHSLPSPVLVGKVAELNPKSPVSIQTRILEGRQDFGPRERNVISWANLGQHTKSLLPSLNNLNVKFKSWKLIRKIRGNPDEWKENYKKIRMQTADLFMTKQAELHSRIRQTVHMVVALGKRYGFETIVAIDSSVQNSTKPLTAMERGFIRAISPERNLSTFAMTDAQLAEIHELPAYLIDSEISLWPQREYNRAYAKMNSIVQTETEQSGGHFVNIQVQVDRLGDAKAYTSRYHLTPAASKAIAGLLSSKISSIKKIREAAR